MPGPHHDKTKILSKNLFPVVGIGASAGGLEAFKRLVKAISHNSGMAYILVQHLHPDHTSSLPEILQRETKIPVDEILDNVHVKADHIYIIPANKMLVATDGILQLSPRPSENYKNMPIDIFFSSLAEVHQSHAIGIVLSGNGTDGTLGLKNIKDHGGITFAQDLDSAAYDSMPQSAINAEVVDFILEPEKIPGRLLELSNTLSSLPSFNPSRPVQITEEESFRQVLMLIRIRTGLDFTYYKQTTIRRRILRRMVLLKLENIEDYLAYLKQNNAEQDILFQDVLIPVTAFFRDPKTFENLCETILPQLIINKSAGNPLRIWVAGCSTGEEAYSIAMCLHEFLSDKISTIKIQIFATDVSQKSIAKARIGLFDKKDLDGISAYRLQQFFIRTEGHYQVKKTIRDMCVFACHNFLKDPPFAKMDLITCRNVLIYMEPFLQKKAFITFHYALNEKGYLLLGKSETAGSSSELFLQSGKKEKIYSKKSLPGRFLKMSSERREDVFKDRDYGLRSNERKKDDFQKDADDILLTKYTPPGVIVNEQFEIVQFRGSTGEFLEASPGKPSMNVLKMAREDLAFELRNALNKTRNTNEPFTREGIKIRNGKLVSIEVIPLPNTIDRHFLILFKDLEGTNPKESKDGDPAPGEIPDEKNTRILQLEKELSQAREDMRTISEDQEAINEELQSANEELLSGTEELQSLNEELETGKEELQSTNEELITVNQELFDRNEQLNQARVYAEAIVTTIHEPLLVLSDDFSVKSANESFYETFGISEAEAYGNNLFELQDKQWNIPGLRTYLMKIQTGNERPPALEATYTFPFAGKRTISFNAQPFQKENDEHWILLAFEDITIIKEKEKIEKKISGDLKIILENIPQITLTASPDGSADFFNKFFLSYSGMSLAEAIHNGWKSIIKPEMRNEFERSWNYSIVSGEDFKMEILLKRKTDDVYRWHVCSSSAIRNREGIITSWVGSATDINDQKTKEKEKDEFISIASHELKTPLTTVKAYVQLLQLGMEKTDNDDLLYAQKANASVDKLNNLITELLDVSKIQNGKLDMQVSTFSFNEMIAAAIEGVQFVSPFHTIIKSGHISASIKGDNERLQQVVINLLTNAVKYSPNAAKVFINISEEKDLIKVSIKDSGIGIRKENLQKIFERYYREEERATHFQGLGIGLFISYEIIQRHNGQLWAESEPGKGSTFYFTLPI